MKNLRKKLFLSILAVAFAVVSLGTSTFAWFAMNNTVTATGMQVSAKSDSEYLIITEGTWNASANTKSITSTHAAVELYPVTPAVGLTSANVASESSWKYAYSDNSGESQPNQATDKYTLVGSGQLGKYVAQETFYVGLNEANAIASNATESEGALMLSGITLPTGSGISVVVVCGNNICTLLSTGTFTATEMAAHATTSGSKIDVYYFINGEDTNVHSDNAALGYVLKGQVQLTFSI